jgi:hypothetical protein
MELREQHGASVRLRNTPSGKFTFTEGYENGFIKYLPQARLMLRVYRIWLSHADLQNKGRLGQTAADFIDWSRSGDQFIMRNKYKYERPYIPCPVGAFANYFREHQKVEIDSSNVKALLRFLRKTRNLASNAASGSFSGK